LLGQCASADKDDCDAEPHGDSLSRALAVGKSRPFLRTYTDPHASIDDQVRACQRLSAPLRATSHGYRRLARPLGHALILPGRSAGRGRMDAFKCVIIDPFIAGLCILVVTPLVSLLSLDIRPLYPGYLLWGRSAARLVLVGVLLYLRPQPVSTSA
jgi:hypothetical protein